MQRERWRNGHAPSRRASSVGPWGERLVTLTETLGLQHHPRWWQQVSHAVRFRNEGLAEQLSEQLSAVALRERLFPDAFRSAETGLDGRFRLGVVSQAWTGQSELLGLTDGDLPHHVFVAGMPGMGKTQLITNLVDQAVEQRFPVIWIDPKADSEHLHKRVDVIRADEFFFNPLAPPSPAVNVVEHSRRFAAAFCETTGMQARGLAILTQALDRLYAQPRPQGCYPSMRELVWLLESKEFQKAVPVGMGRQALHGLVDRAKSLLTLRMYQCERGIDFYRLFRERRVVSVVVDQLSPDQQGLFALFLLNAYFELFRAHGPRNSFNLLFVMDEAGPLIGSANRDHLFVASLFEQLREFGVGVLASVQRASDTSFFAAVAGTKIVFRQGHGADIRAAYTAIGATPEQAAENFSLQPFEALIRVHRLRDIHKIRIPFIKRGEKFVPREELRASMAARLAALTRDVVPDTDRPEATDERATVDLDDRERAFLMEAIARPDAPLTRLYGAIGLSASAGHAVRARLEKRGCIRVKRTNLGRNGSSMLITVVDPDVLEQLGITLGPGRGQLHHTFWQGALKAEAEALGWKARVEWGKAALGAVDVLVEKGEARVGVEVGVASKPTQEVAHVETDLVGLGLDYVVLTSLSANDVARTRELAAARYPALASRVRCCLVTEFARVLGEIPC